MKTIIVKIDCSTIRDWKTFHHAFATAFGFPAFYGGNMNAWIDCMTSIDSDFSQVSCEVGGSVTLSLGSITSFRQRCREIHDALIECVAFVNYRRMEQGEEPILFLSYYS